MKLDQIEEPADDQEMSFLDHLEALRWHIVRSLASVVVFAIGAFIAKDFIFGTVFLGPSRLDFWTYRKLCELSERFNLGDALCVSDMGFTLINTAMAGQFMQHITMSLTVGVVL